jgi:hypothetical protein
MGRLYKDKEYINDLFKILVRAKESFEANETFESKYPIKIL